jgi:uncharacterized membrane protein
MLLPQEDGLMLGITTYLFFKILHVLLAIVAVGLNASYAILLSRAAKEPEHEGHVLHTVKVSTTGLPTPRTGSCSSPVSRWGGIGDVDLAQFWLATSIVLYALLVVLGLAVYSPTLRAQIRVYEVADPTSDEFKRASTRGTVLGAILAIDVIVIVLLMVTKPAL